MWIGDDEPGSTVPGTRSVMMRNSKSSPSEPHLGGCHHVKRAIFSSTERSWCCRVTAGQKFKVRTCNLGTRTFRAPSCLHSNRELLLRAPCLET